MSQFTHYPPVSDKQLGFFIDSSRCSGCKARRGLQRQKQSGSRPSFPPRL